MKKLQFWLKGRMGFMAGFMAASVLFGGLAAAASVIETDLRVSYLPLTYIFDGAQKSPPQDQQGFTYNGRTYVPLRFMAESMGKKVDWDGDTNTIYVGRRPSAVPSIWKDVKSDGTGTPKLEYYVSGALTLRGEEMPDALLTTAYTLASEAATAPRALVYNDIYPPADAKLITGTLFVPSHYLGTKGDRRVGKISISNQLNRVIYESPVLSTDSDIPVPFQVEISGSTRVRIALTLYPDQGVAIGNNVVATQIGISNLTVK